MDDRYVERIGALLAKAESTDSEHERLALIEKAQHLAAKHSIDLAVAAARTPGGAAPALEVERFVFSDEQQNRNLKKHLVTLMCVISASNDVRVDVLSSSVGVVMYGFAGDLLACKTLWTSLSVQMVAEASAWIRTGAWRSQIMLREDRWGRPEAVPMDARVARSGFYSGYVGRIGDRLAAARAAAEREAEAEYAETPAAWSDEPSSYAGGELISTALVIAAKQERVQDFYAESSRARGRWSGPSSRPGAERARAAGWDAGGRARLGDDRDALSA
jgi:hypothetical protein